MKTIKNILAGLLVLSVVSACKDDPEIRVIESSETLDIDYSEEVYKPKTIVYGSYNLVQLEVGDYNSPIILASPHDGEVKQYNDGTQIVKISERVHSSAVTVRDINTTDLCHKIADSLQKLTGLRPHVIVNKIARSHMEPNRALADAYLRHPAAVKAWEEYHDFLKVARQIVKKNVGKGLFIDMHGHGHDNDRIEVGYLLTSNDLNNVNESIDVMAYKTSIFSRSKNSIYPFSSLINGDVAFGTLLANRNCPSVPSKQDPRPWDDEYFNGGYCTGTYGSRRSNDNIDAIQLETPGPIIRNNEPLRIASSGRMSRAIIDYMKLHYELDLMKNP